MDNEIEINGVKYRKVVEPEPAPEWKVGDWAEAISDDNAGRFKVGARGPVVLVWSSGVKGVDVDWKTGEFDPNRHNYKQAYWREIKHIDPPAAPKLKVGDWVKTIEECSMGLFQPGCVGQIKSITGTDNYMVDFVSGNYGHFSDEQHYCCYPHEVVATEAPKCKFANGTIRWIPVEVVSFDDEDDTYEINFVGVDPDDELGSWWVTKEIFEEKAQVTA